MVVGFQPVIQVNLVEIGRHEFLSELMSLAAQDWNLKPGQHSNHDWAIRFGFSPAWA